MRFPNITKLSRLLLALLLAGATTVALAQERPRRAQAPQTEQRQGAPQESVLRLLPADAVTEHTIDVGGSKLAYTATAGTLSLFDQSGDRSAAIFYTAYVAEGRRHHEPPDHLRVQRRAGRRLGVPQPGRGRPAHRRVRHQRPRWLGGAPRRQSRYLAAPSPIW